MAANRFSSRCRLLRVGAAGMVVVCAPLAEPQARAQPATTTAAATQPAEDRAASLQYSRDLITERNNTPRARRGEAERLLRSRWPEAIALLVELIKSPDPTTKLVVCEALRAAGCQDPTLLSAPLAEPLVGLLGDSEAAVADAAADALSCFRNGEVAARLGELAADTSATMPQRLNAVDALAPNIERRTVVEQLVRLLESPSEELRTRVFAALAPAALEDNGRDVGRWKAWWQRVSALNEQQWLEDRVGLFAQRVRSLQGELARARTDAEQRSTQLSRRLEDFAREVYRLIGDAEQRRDVLIGWLRDPQVEVRLVATAIISGEIQDGTKPVEGVREELKKRFDDESAEVRRRALQLVGALNDPADSESIIQRLAGEKEASVREVALRVLGQLPSAAAVPVLIAEIKHPEAAAACVAEAAAALGALAVKGVVDPASSSAVVEPLKARYAAAGKAEVRLREALLSAMAQLGDQAFTPEFVAGLSENDPKILAAAIPGIRAVGAAEHVPQLMTLTEHSDARVRQRALEALAALGGESVHLERLASRMNPATEPNEACRQSAWNGLQQLLKTRPLAMRIEWADRLKTPQERQTTYLEELIAELAAQNPPRAELRTLHRKLAEIYASQGRDAESLPHWLALYRLLAAADDPGAAGAFDAALHAALAARRNEAVTELVALSVEHEQVIEPMVATIEAHLQALNSDDASEAESLRAALKASEKCPPLLLAMLNGRPASAPEDGAEPQASP